MIMRIDTPYTLSLLESERVMLEELLQVAEAHLVDVAKRAPCSPDLAQRLFNGANSAADLRAKLVAR